VKLTLRVLSNCDVQSLIDISDDLPNELWQNVMSVPPGRSIRAPDLLLQDGQMNIEIDLGQIQGRFELLKGSAKEGKTGWSFGVTKATYDPGFEIPFDRLQDLRIELMVDGQPYFTNTALQTIKAKADKKTGNLSKITIKEVKDTLTIDLLKNTVKLSLKNIPTDKFSPSPGEAPVVVNLTLASDEDTLFRNVSRVDANLNIPAELAGKKILLLPGQGEVVPEAAPCD
jgi:hypothetical protein